MFLHSSTGITALFLTVLQLLPQREQFCPHVPVILVGTKIDLRDDPSLSNIDGVSRSHGLSLANEIRAKEYHEVSSLKGLGVGYRHPTPCYMKLCTYNSIGKGAYGGGDP